MDTLNKKTELSEKMYVKKLSLDKCLARIEEKTTDNMQDILTAAEQSIRCIIDDASIQIQRTILKELDTLNKEIDSYKSDEHETILQENERLREEIKNLNETICSWQSGW